jgi:hypothetical protein
MAEQTRPQWPATRIFAGEGRSCCVCEREREQCLEGEKMKEILRLK